MEKIDKVKLLDIILDELAGGEETIEDIKAQMRTWTDAQIDAQAKMCYKDILHPRANRAEIKKILQAINEIREERVRIAEVLQEERKQAEEERQKREELQEAAKQARIETYKQEILAKPQKDREAAIDKIKAVLTNGLLAHFKEYLEVVEETANSKQRNCGKKAAAEMLMAAHYRAVDKARVPTLADWYRLWQPIIGIKPNDANYRENKLDNIYGHNQDLFSPDLKKILYP